MTVIIIMIIFVIIPNIIISDSEYQKTKQNTHINISYIGTKI